MFRKIKDGIKKLLGYTRRRIDFIIADLVSFTLAYFIALLIRLAMNIPVYRGDLVVRYGFVAIAVFLVTEYITQNLNGILLRGFAREMERLAVQMGVCWSIFTVILYLIHEAHDYSRSIYLVAFIMCYCGILAARTLLKNLKRYSRMHEKNSPSLLIICEASRAQEVLERLLPGSLENFYQIAGLTVTDHGEVDYQDCYSCEIGLDKVNESAKNPLIQDAYVELDDPKEESRVIGLLLNEGITVHRSLGESKIDYLSQRVDQIAGKSVITIEDARSSLAGKVDEILQKYREKRQKKNRSEAESSQRNSNQSNE